ncbi:polysaccharide biosynthesis/export family protein [Acidipila sp. EB88]|uniref:polysaccharide biosynthesis/export family protein n=1 Tax=Acidipila sp. EB88 TaxID=2305226 RepID=UPI0013156432|nr:polysaccharide biosynthesis/export family protein [Acidipila sp. EB88]
MPTNLPLTPAGIRSRTHRAGRLLRVSFLSATALCSYLPCVQAHAQAIAQRHPEYILQSGDELDIRFRYTPEFDQLVKVRPDQRVTLLNLGTLSAADLTVSEFQQKVVDLATTRLVKPEVTILLKTFDQPHVLVEGEVATPGRVDLRGDLSVLDAIAVAGGFKSSGAKNQVLLLRRTGDGNQFQTTRLDLAKLIKEQKLEEVGPVRPGDVIYVTQNNLSKVERLAHLGQFGAIYSPVR